VVAQISMRGAGVSEILGAGTVGALAGPGGCGGGGEVAIPPLILGSAVSGARASRGRSISATSASATSAVTRISRRGVFTLLRFMFYVLRLRRRHRRRLREQRRRGPAFSASRNPRPAAIRRRLDQPHAEPCLPADLLLL